MGIKIYSKKYTKEILPGFLFCPIETSFEAVLKCFKYNGVISLDSFSFCYFDIFKFQTSREKKILT